MKGEEGEKKGKQKGIGRTAGDGLNYSKLECGPKPNVMAALPNIGCALCSTPQSLVDAHYWSDVQ